MDLGKSFSFVFEDKKWIEKMLIGGLILIIPIIGVLYMGGYMLETARRVVKGDPEPLPSHSEFGKILVEGLKYFVIGFVYSLPIVAVVIVFGLCFTLFSLMSGGSDNPSLALPEYLVICMTVCFVPLMIIFGIFIQMMVYGGLGEFIQTDDLGKGLQFGKAYKLVRKYLVKYFILLLVSMLLGLVGSAGAIVFGIGAFFTGFYSQAVFGHYLGQFIVEQRDFEEGHPSPSELAEMI
jgi:hypothetical protein